MPKIKIALSATDQGLRYISHKLGLCPLCKGADNSMVSIITFTLKEKLINAPGPEYYAMQLKSHEYRKFTFKSLIK